MTANPYLSGVSYGAGYDPLPGQSAEVRANADSAWVYRTTVNPTWAAKKAKAKRRRRIENVAIVALLIVLGAGGGAVATFEYGPVNYGHSKPVIKSPTYRPSIPTGRRSLLTEV